MTNIQESPREGGRKLRVMLAGGALIGVGGLIMMTGATVAGSALVAAARQRVRDMETPPRDLARLRWSQAKAAAMAGADAWQKTVPPARSTRVVVENSSEPVYAP
ncbi:hypothetical protein J4573_10015 [Actinomadura barringtoniae]|uniref:Uncharacterized protein n=1 Tax=Actinomadura barringtoniae TaxID=1427535 RepID=A0A939PF81_9ACTN|nr:hypothetical protein [Actinomadura barringtoniae]MBO2447421.1 hypothetical protein [Actinomadura barringtoniae]